jgi:hypothetical protein
LTTTITTTILDLMSESPKGEDLGFPIRTPNVKNGDKLGEVREQAKAVLGQRSGDEYTARFVKRDAYRRLDGALRKSRQGSTLNEVTTAALEESKK